MRFPSFNPSNLSSEKKVDYLPLEQNIELAKNEVAEKQNKYDTTRGIKEKIDLEEAQMKLEFLQKELSETL